MVLGNYCVCSHTLVSKSVSGLYTIKWVVHGLTKVVKWIPAYLAAPVNTILVRGHSGIRYLLWF